MKEPLPVTDQKLRSFRMEVFDKLEKREAITFLDINVGHLFDAIKNKVPSNKFQATVNKKKVTISINEKPKLLKVVCGDYDFEFEKLTDNMMMHNYYRDVVLPDNEELVEGTVVIIMAMHQMLEKNDVHMDTLIGRWAG